MEDILDKAIASKKSLHEPLKNRYGHKYYYLTDYDELRRIEHDLQRVGQLDNPKKPLDGKKCTAMNMNVANSSSNSSPHDKLAGLVQDLCKICKMK